MAVDEMTSPSSQPDMTSSSADHHHQQSLDDQHSGTSTSGRKSSKIANDPDAASPRCTSTSSGGRHSATTPDQHALHAAAITAKMEVMSPGVSQKEVFGGGGIDGYFGESHVTRLESFVESLIGRSTTPRHQQTLASTPNRQQFSPLPLSSSSKSSSTVAEWLEAESRLHYNAARLQPPPPLMPSTTGSSRRDGSMTDVGQPLDLSLRTSSSSSSSTAGAGGSRRSRRVVDSYSGCNGGGGHRSERYYSRDDGESSARRHFDVPPIKTSSSSSSSNAARAELTSSSPLKPDLSAAAADLLANSGAAASLLSSNLMADVWLAHWLSVAATASNLFANLPQLQQQQALLGLMASRFGLGGIPPLPTTDVMLSSMLNPTQSTSAVTSKHGGVSTASPNTGNKSPPGSKYDHRHQPSNGSAAGPAASSAFSPFHRSDALKPPKSNGLLGTTAALSAIESFVENSFSPNNKNGRLPMPSLSSTAAVPIIDYQSSHHSTVPSRRPEVHTSHVDQHSHRQQAPPSHHRHQKRSHTAVDERQVTTSSSSLSPPTSCVDDVITAVGVQPSSTPGDIDVNGDDNVDDDVVRAAKRRRPGECRRDLDLQYRHLVNGDERHPSPGSSSTSRPTSADMDESSRSRPRSSSAIIAEYLKSMPPTSTSSSSAAGDGRRCRDGEHPLESLERFVDDQRHLLQLQQNSKSPVALHLNRQMMMSASPRSTSRSSLSSSSSTSPRLVDTRPMFCTSSPVATCMTSPQQNVVGSSSISPSSTTADHDGNKPSIICCRSPDDSKDEPPLASAVEQARSPATSTGVPSSKTVVQDDVTSAVLTKVDVVLRGGAGSATGGVGAGTGSAGGAASLVCCNM